MYKKWWWFLVLIVGIWVGQPQHLAAAGADFTIKSQIPENQIDKKASYYDLLVKPGTTQKLSVVVENAGNKTRKFRVAPNTAFTNDNGVIEYSRENYIPDRSAKTTLSKLMSKAQTVSVAAGESKTVTFTLTVPKSGIDGSVLGGFYVTPEEEESTAKSGMSIQNQFAMVIGIQLRENTTTQSPELKLGTVEAALHNSQTAIKANVRNVVPVHFGQMTITAKVTKSGSSDVLYQSTRKNLEMAPNSNFDYSILMKDKAYQAGDYTLNLVAKSGKKTWTLTKGFTIKAETARELNKKAGIETTDYTWLYIGGAVVLLAVIAGLAFYLGRRKRR
ncbi:DUF916 and DUF3324 domain-containing protein [Lacticaseibacillus brantae]|uniref:Cell surface protein n=1 Tax=Lacticaseibacillus brantae DSM 23927 TaxID=1423727 RepID=A0A0R2B0U5_9LACO|nr:DUF916 and DUF3324 domain-containing protein [Lacticaseibacillus brantae]KRM72960.1 cell surface protein [Lacticaseibacillus brantae DSM 23927]